MIPAEDETKKKGFILHTRLEDILVIYGNLWDPVDIRYHTSAKTYMTPEQRKAHSSGCFVAIDGGSTEDPKEPSALDKKLYRSMIKIYNGED